MIKRIKQFFKNRKKEIKSYKGLSEKELMSLFPYVVDKSKYEYTPNQNLINMTTVNPFGKCYTQWTEEDRKEASGRNFGQNNKTN